MKDTLNYLGTLFNPLVEKKLFSFIFFVIILFLVPFLFLSLFDLSFKNTTDTFLKFKFGTFDLKYCLALWLSIIGIYVSLRVFYALQNKANNLNEFIRHVYNIIIEADDDNEIYIVLPTPFIGYLLCLQGKNNGFIKYQKKLMKLKKLNIAFLTTDLNGLPSIDENDLMSENSKHLLSGFLKDTKANDKLLEFHKSEFENFRNDKYKYKYFAHYINFMNELKSHANITDKAKMDVKISEINTDGKENVYYVVVANKTKEICFSGVVYVYSQTDIHYTGERIKSKSLTYSMDKLYEGYVK
jgi:hypothetical protein